MKIKHTFAVLLLAVTSVFLLSFSSSSSSGDNIVIKKGVFTVNGKNLSSNWSLATCKSALGEPDRRYTGYNIVHTYDSKAINVFESAENEKGTGTVSEFQIYFQIPERGDLSPKTEKFPGSLKIDKLIITKDLSAETMLAKLKKWKKTESYSEHNYRMQYKDLYVYFLFTDDEKSLVKVSVGPNKEK